MAPLPDMGERGYVFRAMFRQPSFRQIVSRTVSVPSGHQPFLDSARNEMGNARKGGTLKVHFVASSANPGSTAPHDPAKGLAIQAGA